MITFTLRDGSVVSYDEPFSNVDGNEGLIKIRLACDSTGGGEGIWAYIHPSDFEDYQNDVVDGPEKTRLVVLSNTSLTGLVIGSIIPAKFKGSQRPECIIYELFDDDTPIQRVGEDGWPRTSETADVS